MIAIAIVVDIEGAIALIVKPDLVERFMANADSGDDAANTALKNELVDALRRRGDHTRHHR